MFYQLILKRGVKSARWSLDRYISLAGVFAPLTTPFDSRGHIDYGALRENVRQYEGMVSNLGSRPLAGYVVMGTTGEFPFLTTDEKIDITKTVRDNSGALLFVGTGCQSAAHTVELTNQLIARVGPIDGALVHAPSCYKEHLARPEPVSSVQTRLVEYFLAVADGSQVPIILYNMPASMGAIDINVNTLADLASRRHPNILGLKECSNDIVKLSLLRQELLKSETDQDRLKFQVVAGSASFLYPALLGSLAVGGICALADVLPLQMCQLLARPTEPAHAALLTANEGTLKRYGIAGIKAAMDIVGLVGGFCRAPLTTLGPRERSDLLSLYRQLGFAPP